MKNSNLIKTIADMVTNHTATLTVIRELLDIYDGISTQTISSDVANVCKACGLKVTEKGIGWVIANK